MLAGVAMPNQSDALGMARYKGRWYIAGNVRVSGDG